jgi:hypothetical protein
VATAEAGCAAKGAVDTVKAASRGPWVGFAGKKFPEDSAARTTTALRGIAIASVSIVNKMATPGGWKRGKICFVWVFKFIP